VIASAQTIVAPVDKSVAADPGRVLSPLRKRTRLRCLLPEQQG
jgi:hypothetical protein